MAIIELLINLLQNFGLIAAAAVLLLSWGAFRKLVLKETTVKDKFILVLFFGAFGVLGSYMGVPVLGAIANLRAMAVITAGLFGGPIVGMGAGLIAGGHRFLMGGFTCIPCGLSTFLEGIAAGLIALWLKEGVLNWRVAALMGLVGEAVHMLIVLTLSRPFSDAWALVKVIAVPMIMMNAVGAGLFVQIIGNALRARERRASIQAHKALNIANLTVSHLRSGLSQESATATARIILDHISVSAVSITDDTHILAFVGSGDDHHQTGREIRTKSTKMVLELGKPVFLKDKAKIGCWLPDCPLQSAIITPLKKNGITVGTFKLYGDNKARLHEVDVQIALGLADLFSTQLELEDIQLKVQLLARAEIKRLQSQINPHFLFNSLNTISSLCRTNSGKARELILELSNYMRRNIEDERDFVRLSDELEQIKSYLSIEQARYGERIKVSMNIEPGCEEWPLPPLFIQPLVENAVKHGLSEQECSGTVWISVLQNNGELHVSVRDDGVGMDPEQIEKIFRKSEVETSAEGIGLKNINQRLEQIYGPQYRMVIDSHPRSGTTVNLRIPRTSSII